MPFHVGEQVTLIAALPSEPFILTMQRYGTVVEDRPSGYVFELPGVLPPNRYGPFPATRLARGWRDENGRWR